MSNRKSNGESGIRKVLFNEVSFILSVVALVASFIFWVTNPQKELEVRITELSARVNTADKLYEKLQNIKDNDLHTIEIKLDSQQAQLVEIQKAIARLEVLIKK